MCCRLSCLSTLSILHKNNITSLDVGMPTEHIVKLLKNTCESTTHGWFNLRTDTMFIGVSDDYCLTFVCFVFIANKNI